MSLWKAVKNYEDIYEVSNAGEVRSKDRKVKTWFGERSSKGKLLNGEIKKDGYCRVQLSDAKTNKTDRVYLHRLVASAFIDNPLNQATIDAIRDTGNGFFKTLIGRGACLPGSKVIYNSADNPAEELSAGHVTFELNFAGASPAERITFKSYIDINLLTQLV